MSDLSDASDRWARSDTQWRDTWGSPIWRENHGYDRPLSSRSFDSDFPNVAGRVEHSDNPRIAKGIMIFMAVGFVVITLAFFKVF